MEHTSSPATSHITALTCTHPAILFTERDMQLGRVDQAFLASTIKLQAVGHFVWLRHGSHSNERIVPNQSSFPDPGLVPRLNTIGDESRPTLAVHGLQIHVRCIHVQN